MGYGKILETQAKDASAIARLTAQNTPVTGKSVVPVLSQRRWKQMTKLTANVVNEAKPGRVWDDEIKGLHLRVTPNGVRSYMLAYRAAGKQRWLTLGRHGAITPQEARTLARKRLGEIASGGDPAADKQAKRQAASEAQADTFEKVAERFIADRKTDL